MWKFVVDMQFIIETDLNWNDAEAEKKKEKER